MRSTSGAAAISLNLWNPRAAPNALAEAAAVSSCAVQTAFSSYSGSALSAGTWALAPQPLPPCVTVAPTMPTRILSAIRSLRVMGAGVGLSPRAMLLPDLADGRQISPMAGRSRRWQADLADGRQISPMAGRSRRWQADLADGRQISPM